MVLDLDLGPWREGFRALRRALDDEMERAVRTTGRALRDEARRSHSYNDRTGTLTRSIAAIPPRGRFSNDTLDGGVVATAPYASFVEDGTSRMRAYQYLGAAWDLQRDETERRVEDAVEAAVRGSGLG